MADVAADRQEHFLGMNEEEERFWKETAARIAVSSITHPLLTVKTLQQLGHEPFPLSTGRTLVFAGRNAYFLPNALSYAKQLTQTNSSGYSVLMTGFESAAVSLIVGRCAARWITKFIDEHYPEMGGKPEFEGKDERELDHHQSFRRTLRAIVRDSVIRTVAVFAARPFTVVCVRQIAQLIGGETKYVNVLAGIRFIGQEEGPAGLFSGVIPQLLGELITVWGIHTLTFAAERALKHSGLDQPSADKDKERAEKDFVEARRLTQFAIPHIVATFSYSFSVVSTVMAVAGSGLAVSFLPYSPSFSHWQDAHDYLGATKALKRGARLFLREQTGAVSVGADRQLYASNKHFA